VQDVLIDVGAPKQLRRTFWQMGAHEYYVAEQNCCMSPHLTERVAVLFELRSLRIDVIRDAPPPFVLRADRLQDCRKADP